MKRNKVILHNLRGIEVFFSLEVSEVLNDAELTICIAEMF